MHFHLPTKPKPEIFARLIHNCLRRKWNSFCNWNVETILYKWPEKEAIASISGVGTQQASSTSVRPSINIPLQQVKPSIQSIYVTANTQGTSRKLPMCHPFATFPTSPQQVLQLSLLPPSHFSLHKRLVFLVFLSICYQNVGFLENLLRINTTLKHCFFYLSKLQSRLIEILHQHQSQGPGTTITPNVRPGFCNHNFLNF